MGRSNCGSRLLIHEIPFQPAFPGVLRRSTWGGFHGGVHVRGQLGGLAAVGRIISGRDDSGGDPGAADAAGDVPLEAGAGAEDDLDAEVTGDGDLLEMSPFHGTPILIPADFGSPDARPGERPRGALTDSRGGLIDVSEVLPPSTVTQAAISSSPTGAVGNRLGTAHVIAPMRTDTTNKDAG